LSKLADKIKQAARSEPQAIGFGSAKAAVVSTMVLAGATPDAHGAAELAQRGADVVISGSANSPVASTPGGGVNGAIAGARIAGTVLNEATQYRESGFDFVVFDPNAAAATALLDEKIGYVLTLPSDFSDNDVRTLESFQLDAIDVGAIASPLTVRKQIDLRRIFAMTRKPLMASIDGAISAPELQALRDANVLVVVVEGAADVERLRKTIDGLPPRSRRKDDDRPTPLVPRTTGVDEEEEDEHDHDALETSY
jgi:hypothetical protein